MQLMPRHVITEFLIISMARTVSLSLTTSAAAAAGTLALAYESGALHLRRGSCGGLCWQRRGCKGDTLAQPQPRAHPRGGFGTRALLAMVAQAACIGAKDAESPLIAICVVSVFNCFLGTHPALLVREAEHDLDGMARCTHRHAN